MGEIKAHEYVQYVDELAVLITLNHLDQQAIVTNAARIAALTANSLGRVRLAIESLRRRGFSDIPEVRAGSMRTPESRG